AAVAVAADPDADAERVALGHLSFASLVLENEIRSCAGGRLVIAFTLQLARNGGADVVVDDGHRLAARLAALRSFPAERLESGKVRLRIAHRVGRRRGRSAGRDGQSNPH